MRTIDFWRREQRCLRRFNNFDFHYCVEKNHSQVIALVKYPKRTGELHLVATGIFIDEASTLMRSGNIIANQELSDLLIGIREKVLKYIEVIIWNDQGIDQQEMVDVIKAYFPKNHPPQSHKSL